MDPAFFTHAVTKLHTSGGLVTVVLNEGLTAPALWRHHPQVYWITAAEIDRTKVPHAIPPNTRILLLADLDRDLFHQCQHECDRRHVPYLSRINSGNLAERLTEIFAKKPAPSAPAPARAERGSLQDFVKAHANLSPALSTAEEARRIFQLTQREGLISTLGSVTTCIAILKRKSGSGSRPESATATQLTDAHAVALALETAIGALTTIKDRVTRLDQENTTLRQEHAALTTLVQQLRAAIGGEE